MLSRRDVIAVERELCRRSLADFAKMAWPVLEPSSKLRWGWALDAICLHLEAVTDGKINRLLMNVPPGSMKSLLTGVIWPAWEWGPRGMPHLRIIGTAHEETLAIRDSRKCRDLIKSQWYQERWPVQLVRDLDGKREFGNAHRGVRQARAFTSMTGVRGDRVILDDPISADSANSHAKLEAARIAFTETLPTRVNSEDSAIVVIMQRLNERDVSGIILDMGLPYTHLCIPMRYDQKRHCTTSIGWTDPRKADGELMFPERFSEQSVIDLEKTLGTYATSGQLQQLPVPRGGSIIKTSWINLVDEIPPLEYTFAVADTAQKTKEENDYSVVQLWGKTKAGGAILIDQIRGKWEAPELIKNVRDFYVKHKTQPFFRGLFIEDKVSGTGLIQTLRREKIPIAAIQRAKDKISRAHDAAVFIESGGVSVLNNQPWTKPLLAEIETFPRGSHDDQIDPMLDACRIVQIDYKPQQNNSGWLQTAHHW